MDLHGPGRGAFLLGCSSSPSGDGKTSSKTASADPKAPAANASSAKWVATLDHGDKPGNGYELIVRDGAVVSGNFYLLDPDRPHDLQSAGQAAAFEKLRADDSKMTFSITLKTGDGEYRESMTIALDDPLIGEMGSKVIGKVQSDRPNAASQELTFVRRE